MESLNDAEDTVGSTIPVENETGYKAVKDL